MTKEKQETEDNQPKYKALGFDSQRHYSGWLSFNGLESSTYSPFDHEEFDLYGDFQDKKSNTCSVLMPCGTIFPPFLPLFRRTSSQ